MNSLFENDQVQDYSLKLQRLVVPVRIEGSNTPASKIISTDLPQAVYVVTEGLSATAAAIDASTNFGTLDDAPSGSALLGILVTQVGAVRKLVNAEFKMTSLSGGSTSFPTVYPVGASNSGVTVSGNIAITLSGGAFALSAGTLLTGNLCLDFTQSE